MKPLIKISMYLSEELLAEIDDAVEAADREEKRSSFIRNAIRAELARRKEAVA